jgi:hypothetical protein
MPDGRRKMGKRGLERKPRRHAPPLPSHELGHRTPEMPYERRLLLLLHRTLETKDDLRLASDPSELWRQSAFGRDECRGGLDARPRREGGELGMRGLGVERRRPDCLMLLPRTDRKGVPRVNLQSRSMRE